MAYSFPYFKPEIKKWFKDNVPTTKRILDVGPGEGTYAILLKEMNYRIDAVEIWAPYINKYNLRDLYDNVYIGDILDFNFSDYDFIILGDVLEHIPKEKATNLINNIVDQGKECLVAVPYMMEQGIHNDNIYETHHQPDLTKDNMLERYPDLKLIYANQYYGYYTHMHIKEERMYVLYANAPYYNTIYACVDSIREFSDIPIIVYMLNSDLEFEISNVLTVKWECDIKETFKTPYIDRLNSDFYKLLIQRPAIIKDALTKYAKTVAYIDADSIATPSIDKIFDFYPEDKSYPYFVEGIYDWLQINGRGGAETRDELYKTLEAPACKLFNVDQSVRQKYRQTGYFVAGQHTIGFLNEWIWMCNHPAVIANPQYYAVFHEETIANVLLWKHNIQEGLPLIYVNGSLERIKDIYSNNVIKDTSWYKKPDNNKDIFFFHGEKNSIIMYKMIEELKNHNIMNILFLAPHLSTGGMPAFLLKRIEVLQKFTKVNIMVVEYTCYSLDYVVQRDKIIQLTAPDFEVLYEDKTELLKIIDKFKPDIIHIDEMSERMNTAMIKKLYNPNRTYRIIETCHDISFNAYKEKRFIPDAFAFCSPYHLKTFSTVPTAKEVIQFPINNNRVHSLDQQQARQILKLDDAKYHVVNIGLWTPGKNQGEGLEVAKSLPTIEFHFIGNQAGNFIEYWEPLMKDIPNNVHIWGERDDATLFLEAADLLMFNSTWECNPLVLREAISFGIPILARNLPQYEDMFTPYIIPLDPYFLRQQITEILHDGIVAYNIPEDNTDIDFAAAHKELYKKVLKHKPAKEFISLLPVKDYQITQHFVNEPFLEILGTSNSDFRVEFYDGDNLFYNNTIKVNHWVKVNRQYYTKWHTKVFKDDKLVYENILNLENKRVYIAFDSKSIGDTLAWMPFVEEFRIKHKCEVIVSTFKNFFFRKSYPNIQFIEPGITVDNIYAMYKIGWFYNKDMEPELPNTVPLQQTASNILGLEYKEIIPKLDFVPKRKSFRRKYITIATNSTAQCKFWTKEGWQKLIDYLIEKGYNVVNVSKERNSFNGARQISEDMPLDDVMNVIYHSDFLIGLSSGLSWIAWALEKEVVMIANFTEKDHEFNIKTTRITNTDVCHGCWNKPEHKFDKGNWNWCPKQKNFECHTSITASMVIDKIKWLLT